jgi:ATP-binding cassette subfamily B protein
MPSTPRFVKSPLSFLAYYVGGRPWHFAGLLALVVGAAACSVGVQVGMKLLVDAMAGPERNPWAVWSPLALFIALIAIENGLWRLGGWLGSRTIVGVGVDVRLDLFEHLSGHPMRYFADHFAGSLGNRITSTAGAVGALISTLTSRKSRSPMPMVAASSNTSPCGYRPVSASAWSGRPEQASPRWWAWSSAWTTCRRAVC